MSEPPTKIVKLDSLSGPLSQSKMEDDSGVSIFLCSDILLEVLRYLTRCQIIKLESAGGRIHRIVKSCLKREPYITRLLILLKPGPIDGLEVEINKFESMSFQRISHNQLGLFLRCCEFLRFECVILRYEDFGFQSIDNICHLFVKYLKPLKAAFSDSTIIEFNAGIGYHQSNFRDPLQLLNHLRNELLPVCDSSWCYMFTFYFCSHGASAAHILEAILQMPPINSSTNVKFNFTLYLDNDEILTRLPVDTISAWLHRSIGMTTNYQKHHQKTPIELKVYLCGKLCGVQNVQELLEHFKKTFKKAESPRRPFIFSLHPFSGVLQAESLSNEKMGEELSIDRDKFTGISLKRSLKKSKN